MSDGPDSLIIPEQLKSTLVGTYLEEEKY